MKRTLVLIDDLYYQYGLRGKEEAEILCLPMLRPARPGLAVRAARKLELSVRAPWADRWLAPWMERIGECSQVILADAGNSFAVAGLIRERWPQKRLILWYRNLVQASQPPGQAPPGCEVWSFDPGDCRAYGLGYNPQFYVPSPACRAGASGPWDAFFVGRDKGRRQLLARMEAALQAQGCSTRFCIAGVNSPRLTYAQVLQGIAGCRVLVDCKCSGQQGMTLRPLEALFYGKKLLTNDSRLAGEAFYHPDNIFIWGQDDPVRLGSFLHSACRPVRPAILAQYGLERWVERFG